ncbi:MAG: hypothetical protein ACYSWU_10505, partial [Planctomycetota bacterium]
AFSDDVRGECIVREARQFDPDVVLLWSRQVRSGDRETLVERIEKLGFRHVDSSRLPPGTEGVFVLAHQGADFRVVQLPARVPSRLLEGSNHDW